MYHHCSHNHLHIYTDQCKGRQLYCIYSFLYKTFRNCSARGCSKLHWHPGVLSSKATKYHCLPFATPCICGNQGFLGELRLLDSSKNWSEAELSICSKRAACDDGISSTVFLPLVKRRYMASLSLAKPHHLLYIVTTRRSRFCMWRDPRLKLDGALVSASSVSVKSWCILPRCISRLLATPKEV